MISFNMLQFMSTWVSILDFHRVWSLKSITILSLNQSNRIENTSYVPDGMSSIYSFHRERSNRLASLLIVLFIHGMFECLITAKKENESYCIIHTRKYNLQIFVTRKYVDFFWHLSSGYTIFEEAVVLVRPLFNDLVELSWRWNPPALVEANGLRGHSQTTLTSKEKVIWQLVTSNTEVFST